MTEKPSWRTLDEHNQPGLTGDRGGARRRVPRARARRRGRRGPSPVAAWLAAPDQPARCARGVAAGQRRRPRLGQQAAAAHPGGQHGRNADHHELGRLRHAAGRAASPRWSGWLVGFAFGAVVALGCWRWSPGSAARGEDAVDPLMQMVRTLPLFGLIPVFIIWFGIGELPKVLLIAIGAAIPLYLNTFAGIRGVDRKLGRARPRAGARRTELIRNRDLPGALPQHPRRPAPEPRRRLAVARRRRAAQHQLRPGLHDQPGHPVPAERRDLRRAARATRSSACSPTGSCVDLERRALAWRGGLLAA